MRNHAHGSRSINNRSSELEDVLRIFNGLSLVIGRVARVLVDFYGFDDAVREQQNFAVALARFAPDIWSRPQGLHNIFK